MSSIDRAKIQQTADNMHVPIYLDRDGGLTHLKPGGLLPAGAELFRPQRDWPSADHGERPPEPIVDDCVEG